MDLKFTFRVCVEFQGLGVLLLRLQFRVCGSEV